MLFFKYHNLGNDFVILDDRDNQFQPDPKKISLLCHRRCGIGADGLILLKKSLCSDIRMQIFNSDGYEADMCGNALFCSMRIFAEQFQWKKKTLSIETKRGVYEGRYEKEDEIRFRLPKIKAKENIFFQNRKQEALIIDSGVDHLVLFVNDFSFDLEKEGRSFRNQYQANVDFVMAEKDSAAVRTYEKGVEKETLACGTGAAAAFYAMHQKFLVSSLNIHFKNGNIFSFKEDTSVVLSQKAVFVFKGKSFSTFN